MSAGQQTAAWIAVAAGVTAAVVVGGRSRKKQ